jgi:hypothetical protein
MDVCRRGLVVHEQGGEHGDQKQALADGEHVSEPLSFQRFG